MSALFGAFSVGKDVTLTVINPITGALMPTINVTDFESSPQTKKISSNPLSAPPLYADIPDGWRFSFTIDRTDSTWDDYYAALEQAYWTGVTIGYATVNEFIQEKTNSVSQFTYVNATLVVDNAGSKKSQDKIPIRVSGMCSQRIKVV